MNINPPCGFVPSAKDRQKLAVTSIRPVDNYNKEVSMTDREAHRAQKQKKALEEYQQWQEASKAHWSHWRAWGSWFSWGSPVGLGMFFVLLSVTFAIFKWALSL